MPGKKASPNAANLMVNCYDGTRKLLPNSVEVFITIFDGHHQRRYRNFRRGPSHYFRDLPFFNNFGDNYTVIVSAEGYKQAGFTPIKIAQGTCQRVDLMLLPEDASFNFHKATWDALKETNEALYKLLCSGISNEERATDRYDTLREEQPATVAAFLNITTALSTAYLPEKTPLDYFKKLIWDDMKQDRFFAYADKELLNQVECAAAQGQWEPEFGSSFFHPGATRSFKQVQFGEANVQLTFHEEDKKRIEGIECLKVEPDMDYYKDIAAHTILEVIPNTLTGQKTDPKNVYVLRWIAGRKAGVPEFDPPYVIVSRI